MNAGSQLLSDRPTTQALQRQIGGLQLNSLEDMQAIGQILVKSGFFSDATDAAKAIVKVMAGAEIGFPPIASMMGINIIKGKVSHSANLIAAAIKKSRIYSYKIKHLDGSGCAIEFFENGQSVGISTFTRQDAERSNLTGGDNWRKFPRNMFFARAMSNGAKWYCPDIFNGVPIYTPDELGAPVDGETGEVIDIPAERIEATEPVETAPPDEPGTPEALKAINNLWPKYGRKIDGKSVTFAEYLRRNRGIADPRHLTQEDAAKMLQWLQQKALAVEEEPETVHQAEIIEEREAVSV